MDPTEYHAILHAEFHQLKSTCLAEATYKAIRLAEAIETWRQSPLVRSFADLQDMAADILRLLGEARGLCQADTLIDE